MMEEASIHDEEEIRDFAAAAASDCHYLDIESGQQCPWLYPQEQPRRRREGGSLPPPELTRLPMHQRPAPAAQESKELVSCLAGSRRGRHRSKHAHAHAHHSRHHRGGGRAHHHRHHDASTSIDAPIDICETRRVTFDPSPLIQTLSFSSSDTDQRVDKSALFYSRAECRAFRREVERELEQHRMLVDLVTLDEVSIQPSKVNLNDDDGGATEAAACRTVRIDREVEDGANSARRRGGLFGAGVFGGTYGNDDDDDEDDDDMFSGALPIHDCDCDCDDLESDAPRPAALISCGEQALSVNGGAVGAAGAVVWRERALQAAMVAAAAAACYCGGGLMDRWAATMMSMPMSDPW